MSLCQHASIRRALCIAVLSVTFGASCAGAAESVPAPRDAAGKMLISNAPGQPMGLWVTDYSTNIPFFNIDQVKFKPWAKGLYDARQAHDLEPHARCKASGAIRQLLTPYGVEMLEIPELKQLFIFDVGGPHTWREINMDGRPLPQNPEPTNYGYSIGHWEGDTLVIESTGYNTEFWFERAGLPHTESVRVTEYYTRRDKNTMDYRFVMTDPMTYDAPVEGRLRLNWREGEELFEYVCQQSNYATDLMVNEDTLQAIGNSNFIIP
jgi:hypothetical protein